MESTIKKMQGSKILLDVSLDKEELKEFAQDALKNLANSTRLEGFRPGKAPKELIKKQIGEEKIRQEALEIALRSSFAEVIKKEELDVINQNNFKIEKNSPDGLEYSMVLTVFPEIHLGKYTGLDIKKIPIVVKETEIDETLKELVKIRTTSEQIDRPTAVGDKVEVDFEIFSDGKLIEGGKSENHPLIIGEKKFIPGFEDQIVGMAAGEKKSFSIKVPEDYIQKEIAGKEIEINLILKKVEQLLSPLVNDEFAKSLGHFGSLEDLRNNLRQGLKTEKENKEKERLRLSILGEMVSKSEIDPPDILVEERIDALIHDFDGELHNKGLELGLYLAHLKKTQDDLRKDWRQKAESQVRMSLIVKAIGRKEKVIVSEKEINDEFALLASHYTSQGMLEELKKSDPENIKARIRDVLLTEKVLDFLEKNNVVA